MIKRRVVHGHGYRIVKMWVTYDSIGFGVIATTHILMG